MSNTTKRFSDFDHQQTLTGSYNDVKTQKYTEAEVIFLKENYKNLGPKKCAEILNRKYASVACKAANLGVKNTPHIMNEEKFEYVKDMVINHGKNLREMSIELDINYSALREYCFSHGFNFKQYITKEARYKNNKSKDGGLTRLYNLYKNNSKKRNLDFTLDKEQFYVLIKQNCYYCNQSPSNKFGVMVYNGIDRIDNSIGYTLSNSQTCCETCNFMKNTSTNQDFLNKVTKIFNNLIRD